MRSLGTPSLEYSREYLPALIQNTLIAGTVPHPESLSTHLTPSNFSIGVRLTQFTQNHLLDSDSRSSSPECILLSGLKSPLTSQLSYSHCIKTLDGIGLC